MYCSISALCEEKRCQMRLWRIPTALFVLGLMCGFMVAAQSPTTANAVGVCHPSICKNEDPICVEDLCCETDALNCSEPYPLFVSTIGYEVNSGCSHRCRVSAGGCAAVCNPD